MGLLQQKAIGIEVSHGGVSAVMLCRQSGKLVLKRATRVSFPAGTIRQSLKEPNILQPPAFIAALREAWGSLHLSLHNVALSLPDSAGHLMLVTLEEPWKRNHEAGELLRWKLAKRLGLDPELLHLDFQLLERHENGATDLLVALVHRTVILQYEDLLLEAGLQPTQIGFHSLHLLRLFDRFKAGAGQIITLYDNALSTVTQTDRRLVFCRVKQLPEGAGQTDRLRHELAASLAASRHACGGTVPGACYAMAAPDGNDLIRQLTTTVGEPPHQLRLEAVIERDEQLAFPATGLFQASAAIGAALGACR